MDMTLPEVGSVATASKACVCQHQPVTHQIITQMDSDPVLGNHQMLQRKGFATTVMLLSMIAPLTIA